MQTHRAISAYYREIDGLVKRFIAVHNESIPYLSSMVNTASRLEHFRKPEDMGILTRFENANVMLEHKHVQAADGLFKALMLSVDIFEEISQKLQRLSEKVAEKGRELHGKLEEFCARTETRASVMECVLWAEDIASSFTKEFLEKKMILHKLRYHDMEALNRNNDLWLNERITMAIGDVDASSS